MVNFIAIITIETHEMVNIWREEGGLLHIKQWRKRIGLTQEKLADLVNVHLNTLSRWELGQREPRASEIIKLCEVLGVSEAELLRDPAEKRWEVRVILEEPKEVDVMNLTKDAPNEALVEIGTHKIAVKIVGDVENESELDNLLAEVKEKALDGLGLKRKWAEA